MSEQPRTAPVAQLAAAARQSLEASAEAQRPLCLLELALSEMALGRPSVAEPMLRELLSDVDLGQKSLRELVVLLAETSRPGDAVAAAAELDQSPQGRLVAAWVRLFDGDDTAFEEVERAGHEIDARDLLENRLLHQARAQVDSDDPQQGIIGWIEWLREHEELDRFGVERPTAWVVATEMVHAMHPKGAPRSVVEPLMGMLPSAINELPPGHPVRTRGNFEMAIAFGNSGSSTFATMWSETAYREIGDLDPLLEDLIRSPVEAVWEHAGRPRRVRISDEIMVIVCPRIGALLLATDPVHSDTPGLELDIYGSLMRKSTSRQFLRALVDLPAEWKSDSVQLGVRPAGDDGGAEITFPATQRGAKDFTSYVSAAEVEQILAFADQAGIRPGLTEEVGRNEACPCGSGRKYKRCCGA